MTGSSGKGVDLRIRFAGLCLFVPDATKKLVHVLMPKTDGHASGHSQKAHAVPAHLLCLYWVSGGEPCRTSLSKDLVLNGPGWGDADLTLPGVFHINKLDRPGGCDSASHGKADVANAPTAARMVLHAGKSRVVNPGARWKVSATGPKHGMPTAIDWRVKNVPPEDLMALLSGWDVFGNTLPDTDDKNTVNLWIIHAPEDEQFPEEITGKPKPVYDGRSHFPAYYTLLKCRNYNAPVDPESENDIDDPDQPHWPEQRAVAGMLVSCMVVKADAG